MTKRILVIHGPNLNKLGEREPEIYGDQSIDQLNDAIKATGNELGFSVACIQSNSESDIVDTIQNCPQNYDGLLINPAAFSHYSIAIRDALTLINIPKIEIHISNIQDREAFRQHSITAPACTGQISGLGQKGYLLALHYFK